VNRALLLLLLASACAFAQEKDVKLEERVAALSSELRCLVCQNQTIADSSAPLAVDLRNTIREQLARGASEREVLDFMTARYGDFVLYRPPLKATTVLLWAGPFLLLALGIVLLVRSVRRRPDPPALDEDERAAASRMLDGP
jgi:cytochrome c-type biogenesis protein CcmH